MNILNQNLLPEVFFLLKQLIQLKQSNKNGKVKLNALIFHLHGNSSSCGVFIAFFGSKSVTIAQNISDNNDRILLL